MLAPRPRLGEATQPGTLQPIRPEAWAGEVECLVGPFESRDQAHTFATLNVDFQRLENVLERIFAKGDAWYLELRVLSI